MSKSKKRAQTIVCAACCYEDIIITGVRHWDTIMGKHKDLLNRLDDINGVKRTSSAKYKQGFIDQYGDFLTRTEAMFIVKENGQKINFDRNGWDDDTLYSEGLY